LQLAAAKDNEIDETGMEPAGLTRYNTTLKFNGWICCGFGIGSVEEQ
jgi:hypothetical protein